MKHTADDSSYEIPPEPKTGCGSIGCLVGSFFGLIAGVIWTFISDIHAESVYDNIIQNAFSFAFVSAVSLGVIGAIITFISRRKKRQR